MIKPEINLRVKGKLVIYQFKIQKSKHKKMICYFKELNKLICKYNKVEGLNGKKEEIDPKRL